MCKVTATIRKLERFALSGLVQIFFMCKYILRQSISVWRYKLLYMKDVIFTDLPKFCLLYSIWHFYNFYHKSPEHELSGVIAHYHHYNHYLRLPTLVTILVNQFRWLRPQSTSIPRVPQCLSPRRNWDPLSRKLVCIPLPPKNQRRVEHTRLRVSGWGSPNSDDWRKSLSLCLLSGWDQRICYCKKKQILKVVFQHWF
jgi:hypothetical protein